MEILIYEGIPDCAGKIRKQVFQEEQYVRGKGGKCMALHAQCRVAAFYEKLGYTEVSGVENEEGCPHVWMRKEI